MASLKVMPDLENITVSHGYISKASKVENVITKYNFYKLVLETFVLIIFMRL